MNKKGKLKKLVSFFESKKNLRFFANLLKILFEKRKTNRSS